MAVQLHYYGSVFNLSESYADRYWGDTLASTFDDVKDGRFGRLVNFALQGGGEVSFVFDANTHYALVTR
ncbi:hypothetical protein CH252_18650 [Rhodococcus sp. 06-1477-1B]|nr:hypothetical protein CH252_18650 [Rhodococcus sp. 06-1477-1B]